MIRTIGELLEELRQAEAKKLGQSRIAHGPTIGAMYEGLTKDLLGQAMPQGLNLRMVSGFATDGRGKSSGQLDCMLVRGEGTPVPYVDGVFEWHVKDVLAVVEVKKTLFAGGMVDAYDQLRRVSEVFSSWVQDKRNSATFNVRASQRVYAECVGEVVPDDLSNFDPLKHLIWHAIMIDQIAPVRIALGYGGYASEAGLRTGFLKFLESNLGKTGYGPPSIPNLIVGEGASLIKLSGHPFHAPMINGWWPIVASSTVNPSLLVLEHLWTRISYERPAPDVFGEDLTMERLSPLLDAKPVAVPGSNTAMGWQFRPTKLSSKQLKSQPKFDNWVPVELDVEQFTVVTRLCREDVSTADPSLLTALKEWGRSPGAFFDELVKTTLVARDGDTLTLTTVCCATAVLPDGRFVAGEDNSGRFSRWLAKYNEERRPAGRAHK